MSKNIKTLVVFATIFILLYGFWRGNVGLDTKDPYTPIDSVVISFQNNPANNSGNMVGVQPFMSPSDYASAEAFYKSMDNYLFDASAKQFLNEKSVVVFPEYIGSWLVGMDEKAAVYNSSRIDEAMKWIVFRHPFDFIKYYSKSASGAPDKEAIFQLKSKLMAKTYFATFSRLASVYNVTLVAGSILLPEPFIDDKGILQVKPGGKLYNTCAVFNPDGSINPTLVKKIYPTNDEISFICPGELSDLPVFDTPAGKLGVLVCADSWFPKPYQVLKDKGVELIAVPSFVAGDGMWAKPWSGYSSAMIPEDVDRQDIGKITEREAWMKYAMPARAAASGIHYGVNVFLRGDLWDLGSDGETLVVGGDNTIVLPFALRQNKNSSLDLITSINLR